MAIFYSDESDVDTLCKKTLFPEMRILAFLNKYQRHKIPYLNASSFKPNKTNRGRLKY